MTAAVKPDYLVVNMSAVMDSEEQKPPLRISEALQVCSLGVPASQITWSRVTLSSDKYLCIRHDEKVQGNKENRQVMVLDAVNMCQPDIFTMPSVTGAMMSPTQPHLAAKVGETQLMLINKATKEIISKCVTKDDVIYWAWVTANVIVIITEMSVFHWDPYAGGDLMMMFDLHERLVFSEIVNYHADSSLKWLAVTGLFPQGEHISGITQLYAVDLRLSQCIDAHAVCFTEYQFEGNAAPSRVLCVASREDESQFGKLHVIELGPHLPGNLALSSHYDHIKFMPDEEDKYDFPIAILVSPRYGLLYLMTKYGWLFLCDLETATCLCSMHVSKEVVFAAVLNSSTDGIYAVNRSGQVLDVELKKALLVPYIKEVAKKGTQASRLQRVIDQMDTDTLVQLH